jgi:hypothetical protein
MTWAGMHQHIRVLQDSDTGVVFHVLCEMVKLLKIPKVPSCTTSSYCFFLLYIYRERERERWVEEK